MSDSTRPSGGPIGNNNELDQLLAGITAKVSPLLDVMGDIHALHAPNADGEVASYIPELQRANPDHFGIALTTIDGQTFSVGDHKVQFTIQSISKPLVYGMVLGEHGAAEVRNRVGVEPSGDAFNAIELNPHTNRPFNPMVNAGAIATTDLVGGAGLAERTRRVQGMLASHAGRELSIDNAVLASERTHGQRNRAMALLMQAAGAVSGRVEESLELYFSQCSTLISADDLSVMAATLANGGTNPVTGEQALDPGVVTDVLAVMYTCGMYDRAGQWSVDVGLPAKSGVAGGIMAIVPGRLGIGVYSPPLDHAGNSVRGVAAVASLSNRLGLYVLDPHPDDKVAELRRPRRRPAL